MSGAVSSADNKKRRQRDTPCLLQSVVSKTHIDGTFPTMLFLLHVKQQPAYPNAMFAVLVYSHPLAVKVAAVFEFLEIGV